MSLQEQRACTGYSGGTVKDPGLYAAADLLMTGKWSSFRSVTGDYAGLKPF